MSDKQATSKLAMSRALGAAFLSHQVEQLEKSVGRESRSTASNNWRERTGQMGGGRGGKRNGAPAPQVQQGGRKKDRREVRDGRESGKLQVQKESSGANELEKDADIIVVDASVLVHALGQLKKWCRDGRKEVVLIPLEALNTLDLLKKGSTPLAQRARAASRILESQVGTNPRIRVQRDDAFVLWGEIPFQNLMSDEFPALGNNKLGSGHIPSGMAPPPEWLRRTICCARWEMVNAISDLNVGLPAPSAAFDALSRSSTPTSSVAPSSHSSTHHEIPTNKNSGDNPVHTITKAVLAVVSSASSSGGSSLETSTSHPGRHERADGSLVRIWAQRAGIEVLDVEPTVTMPASHFSSNHGHPSPERRRSHLHHGGERRDFREGKDSGAEREEERKTSLVEKPIAMAIVNEQPVKVLRVLARGEKLDP
ncbi:hypothetical protein K439DRAFT_1662417 [Ramaria rubella]|nr:hypothetical protein K439DRAFT_1662417 [Ramaria rubella]